MNRDTSLVQPLLPMKFQYKMQSLKTGVIVDQEMECETELEFFKFLSSMNKRSLHQKFWSPES